MDLLAQMKPRHSLNSPSRPSIPNLVALSLHWGTYIPDPFATHPSDYGFTRDYMLATKITGLNQLKRNATYSIICPLAFCDIKLQRGFCISRLCRHPPYTDIRYSKHATKYIISMPNPCHYSCYVRSCCLLAGWASSTSWLYIVLWFPARKLSTSAILRYASIWTLIVPNLPDTLKERAWSWVRNKLESKFCTELQL